MRTKLHLSGTRAAVIAASMVLCFISLVKAQNTNEYLRGNLYVIQNGSPLLIDGNLTHYHASNSNNIDYDDAYKLSNPGENFGILRNGVTLAVEKRKIFTMSDTTYFRMWNLRPQPYILEMVSLNLNHPNVTAFLVDNYLNRRYPVSCNGNTRVEFDVNSDPRSYEQTRFKVIFRQNNPVSVPVKFSGLRLRIESANTAKLDWDVNSEYQVEKYEVQKSVNGTDFETIDELAPFNEGVGQTYTSFDRNCLEETYYRIKGSGLDGVVFYSGIARLRPVAKLNEIAIYPNPVVNKEVQIYMNEPAAGTYTVMLIGTNGQLRSRRIMQVGQGQNLNKVSLPSSTNPGIYLLQIIGPDNSRVTKTISVL